ncbi:MULTISPECIES: hypothetical protein [Thermoactinomyces]|jgi:hypothetical protein|uniref:Uncharacterized protein n=1 Tax=Thermoactinomyces daqus TaxID=1329516 RepID=A0A7W1XCK2_9BACL|nr:MULTISPECIES: hypothetical protein [Thermoactinomyces]MBA4544174.1 hypothetical protein [Thermoactinomyces daqus]MBH8597050.1 hypothetical protein [Thermoactinomyces sp. CICC 10523]MBH8602609.1 hypothetical protein [Thermoactinomyces sp. CICC 10522]MBH8606279.1 hypothetical protein [Thermoactinomyces sp. CICC 10521]
MDTVPFEFRYDQRLGIKRPFLHQEYEALSKELQDEFELKCQEICSQIPERVKMLEREYMQKFNDLKEMDDETSFLRLTEEMNELSRRICDLNILYLHIEGTYLAANVHA